jgi:ribosomal protein S18 acetylase RimI-like enzyme
MAAQRFLALNMPDNLISQTYTCAVTSTEIKIERVLNPNQEHVEALVGLLPQLSSAPPPSLEKLHAITANASTYLYLARLENKIVGSLTLATFSTLTGKRAWIEDVVVDLESRGRGIASALVSHALDQAKELGTLSVELTSRPDREAANYLYKKLGFTQRVTNVYRYVLES